MAQESAPNLAESQPPSIEEQMATLDLVHMGHLDQIYSSGISLITIADNPEIEGTELRIETAPSADANVVRVLRLASVAYDYSDADRPSQRVNVFEIARVIGDGNMESLVPSGAYGFEQAEAAYEMANELEALRANGTLPNLNPNLGSIDDFEKAKYLSVNFNPDLQK